MDQQQPSAAQLLSLICFYDRGDIPKSMVQPPMAYVDLDGKDISDRWSDDPIYGGS